MNKRFKRHLQITVIILDFLMINSVFLITEYLFQESLVSGTGAESAWLSLFLSFNWLIIALVGNIYHERNIVSFESFSRRSAQGILWFLVLICGYILFFLKTDVSRLFLSAILLCIPLALLLNRFLYLAFYRYFRNKDYLIDKVLVVGYNNLSKQLIESLEENEINKEVVGICDESENVHELSNYPILGGISNAFQVCKQYGATEIYSSISPEHNHEIYKLIQLADQNCIHFRIIPDFSVFVKRKSYINNVNGIPLISFRREPLEDLGSRIKKRIFDIVVSVFVLIFILSWLIPLIGLLILIESRGPVFFAQKRSGKGNKEFWCLKFRSMKVNDQAHEKMATKNDSRLTRIGKFLRKSSLDEFPQFLNVLRGHMSIVGPRPHMLKHTDEFSRVVNQYMVRHFLKPGITGWAQVNGYRGEVNSIEKLQCRVEHDVWYLENWSVWLDLKIVFMTVINTVKGEENAF
jgi:putative colanic acid biosynthesis UDP-glucose lipid carrier transferase